MDDEFPQKLKSIKPEIKKIYACGNLSLLRENAVAVVGARNCTEYGKFVTKKITKNLVDNNVVIVSGMAVGIDAVAHRTCLEYCGKTIAVLGSGFRNIYPKENEGLFNEIINNDGLIISEYPIDEPVQMKNFPKRNRIVSGLSDGVLVVEATYRSGTSITAKLARAQGKKVFYIPNCIGNKNSSGFIRLARDGAIMVTSGNDILNELKFKIINDGHEDCNNIKRKLCTMINKLDDNSKKIFNCLRANETLDCEEICIKTGIRIDQVNQLLSYMELENIISCVGINKYTLSKEYCE